VCAFFLQWTFLLYEGVTRAEGALVIIIQIFSFARARRINIYNAFQSANPLARVADREKSSRFKQTFSLFLRPKNDIFTRKYYTDSKNILMYISFNISIDKTKMKN